MGLRTEEKMGKVSESPVPKTTSINKTEKTLMLGRIEGRRRRE